MTGSVWTMGSRGRAARVALLALVGFVPLVRGARAQDASDAYLDADARALHARARARWREVDGSIVRYQAVVRERMAASLRLPVRDRTLYAFETSARMVWERDGGVAIQMLSAAEHLPSGFNRNPGSHATPLFDAGFDPAGDPLLLGLGEWNDGDVEIAHPLDGRAEQSYRFRTGDTLTISLPDGHSVRAVELQLIPRRDDPHLLSGALWIEPESGNLVRGVYRLARAMDLEHDTDVIDQDDDFDKIPGILRPFTIDVSTVAVDYSLWDLKVWMPRTMRVEGTARAGIVSVPVSMEMAYDVEEVITDVRDATDDSVPADSTRTLGMDGAMERLAQGAAAAGETRWKEDPRRHRRNGKRVRYLVPEDPSWLQHSPYLPGPIWKDDARFVSPVELDELKGVLADVPLPATVTTLGTFDWGWQRPDLLRYNRVEGLSVGARGAVRFGLFGRPLSASATGRIGFADLEPRGVLALSRETLSTLTTLSAYRELEPIEPSARPLGLGNTLNAMLFGRDDGDYFQHTGASLAWAPSAAHRPSWHARLYAERQDPVLRETDISLFHEVGWADGFRPGAPGLRADQAGAEVALSPGWGRDPQQASAGLDLSAQVERGDFDFGRERLQLRAALPLPRGGRLGLAVAGGTTQGDAPPQRRFILGGPFSLRGFAPGVASGPSFLSGRVEAIAPLRKVTGVSAVRLTLFMDGGWAGERSAFRWDDAVASWGAGVSILDGILRLDAAWGWKGPSSHRVDLYLDGLL